jgi:hypothetical protein
MSQPYRRGLLPREIVFYPFRQGTLQRDGIKKRMMNDKKKDAVAEFPAQDWVQPE